MLAASLNSAYLAEKNWQYQEYDPSCNMSAMWRHTECVEVAASLLRLFSWPINMLKTLPNNLSAFANSPDEPESKSVVQKNYRQHHVFYRTLLK